MSTDLDKLNALCAEADKAAREVMLERKAMYTSFALPGDLAAALLRRTKPMTWDDNMLLRHAFEDAYQGMLQAVMWAKVDGKERVTFPATWWDAVKAHWLPRLPHWLRRRFAPARYQVVEMERHAFYPTIPIEYGKHMPLRMFDRREWIDG